MDPNRIQERIVGLREALHRHPPIHPLLQLVWQAAADHPEIIRESPHRTVLRVVQDGAPWLLKICHPRRRGETLRNWLRLPPALREAEAACRLGYSEILAEQVASHLGLFLRRWQEGTSHPLPEEDGSAWGRGLTQLHDQGWSDADLAAPDFLWSDSGILIPLDLGQAKVSTGPTHFSKRQRDFIRLLANLSPTQATASAEAMCLGIAQAGGPKLIPKVLLDKASEVRRRRLWRRGRRVWRPCSDFRTIANGALRHGFALPEDLGTRVRRGQSSQVWKNANIYGKKYRRPYWRTALSRGPAAATARALHVLELANLPAARVMGWCGTTLWTQEVPYPQAKAKDLQCMEAWLAEIHAWGFGMRDCKLENFCIGPNGAILVDGDGLTARTNSVRDRARLQMEWDLREKEVTKDGDGDELQRAPSIPPEQAPRPNH